MRLIITIILLFLTADIAHADDTKRLEWNDQYVSGVNKEKAYTISIPFADENQARNSQTEDSPYYKTLNGAWKFHWVADPKDRPDDFYQLG